MAVIRKTKSVRAVLDAFEQGPEAISVVSLVHRLQDRMNKSTVYRILERLGKEGMVHSFCDKDGLTWYAKCDDTCDTHQHFDNHPHFQCTACGKMQCLDVSVTVPTVKKHKITSVNVLMFGQCEACQA